MHIDVTRVFITLIWLKSVTSRHEVMLLLTSNHKEVPYTHLIDPRGIQGWVCHGVTIWFQHLWTATSGSKTVDPLPLRKINFKGKTKKQNHLNHVFTISTYFIFSLVSMSCRSRSTKRLSLFVQKEKKHL